MPTNQNAYNSRVTDEALEKRFRDTFRSQGGAELVDDLYASGVIVPVVDFTAAATGTSLAQNLQTAWDFTTGWDSAVSATQAIISNAGFWQVEASLIMIFPAAGVLEGGIRISDGLSSKDIWLVKENQTTATISESFQWQGVVFVRSGDTVNLYSNDSAVRIQANYRQIATVNGDLVDPSGFTSS